jgi:uncharacterized protein involved in outer membrane biogenesis
VDRMDGAYDYFTFTTPLTQPSGLQENLKFQESTFLFTAHQLVGERWSFGLSYRLSQAVLNDDYPTVPDGLIFDNFQPRQRTEGTLQQVDCTAIYNHPRGFFAEGEALWNRQDNTGYTPDEPGDAFWQLNAFIGYRSPHRRAEISLGLLNINNQDYNLNPLNIYNELPRKRTLIVSFKLNF